MNRNECPDVIPPFSSSMHHQYHNQDNDSSSDATTTDHYLMNRMCVDLVNSGQHNPVDDLNSMGLIVMAPMNEPLYELKDVMQNDHLIVSYQDVINGPNVGNPNDQLIFDDSSDICGSSTDGSSAFPMVINSSGSGITHQRFQSPSHSPFMSSSSVQNRIYQNFPQFVTTSTDPNDPTSEFNSINSSSSGMSPSHRPHGSPHHIYYQSAGRNNQISMSSTLPRGLPSYRRQMMMMNDQKPQVTMALSVATDQNDPFMNTLKKRTSGSASDVHNNAGSSGSGIISSTCRTSAV